MTNTFLTLERPIDQGTLDILLDFHGISTQCGVDYVLVGARARDLILHHGYGAPIRRATADIDFAVQVRDWEAFHAVRDALLADGYTATLIEHRLRTRSDGVIDIVPFGDIASQTGIVAWPPEGTTEMTVTGFEESYQSACVVQMEGESAFKVRVASPEGLMIMKLIAWTERDPSVRRKDAADIAYLLQYYERTDADRQTLYEPSWMPIFEHYGYDTLPASAHLLGYRIRQMAQPDTLTALEALFNDHLKAKSTDVLLREMAIDHVMPVETYQLLLEALVAGFEAG